MSATTGHLPRHRSPGQGRPQARRRSIRGDRDAAGVAGGAPYPLGATFNGSGTNFAVFSEVADKVELCLFDAVGAQTTVELTERDAFVWHGYLPHVVPGQRYGYRVRLLRTLIRK